MDTPSSKYPDDETLVGSCLEGTASAWDAFQEKYNQLIYSILRWPQWRFNQEDIEDMFEEIYIRLIESGLRRFEFQCQLSSYIGTITKNMCLDRVRSKSRKYGATLSLEQDERMGRPLEQVIDSGVNVAEIVLKKETIQEINAAFMQLKEVCQKIIKLRYREEMAYDQIAKFVNMPIGTVGALIARCTDSLIEFMQPLLEQARSEKKKGMR